MLKQMIEYRRLAAHARCRIKAWRLREDDAWTLAAELVCGALYFLDITEIYQMLKQGSSVVLGARVIIR